MPKKRDQKAKSISDAYIIDALKKVGVTILNAYIEDAHVGGMMRCSAVKGFDYKKSLSGYPWDKMSWFSSHTGSGDACGNGEYDFQIDISKLPKTVKNKILAAHGDRIIDEEASNNAQCECDVFANDARAKAFAVKAEELGLKEMQAKQFATRAKLMSLFWQAR